MASSACCPCWAVASWAFSSSAASTKPCPSSPSLSASRPVSTRSKTPTRRGATGPDSKHWFTTSFLQPLPYLVTPLGYRKLSANDQFFAGAQTVVAVSLLQLKLYQTFVLYCRVAYASSNKTKIVCIETELFCLPGVDATHVYVRAWALGCFHSLISTQTFRMALTASVDSCAEMKCAPSVAQLNLAEFGGRRRKAMLGVCHRPCRPWEWNPEIRVSENGQTANLYS